MWYTSVAQLTHATQASSVGHELYLSLKGPDTIKLLLIFAKLRPGSDYNFDGIYI